MTDTTESAAPQASLSDLRMPELQALATRMGISGISKMRKPELVEAIRDRRRANAQRRETPTAESTTRAAEPPTPTNDPPAPAAEPPASTNDRGQAASDAPAPESRSRQRRGNRRARSEEGNRGAVAAPEAEPAPSADADQKMASLDEIIHFPEPADRGPQESQRNNRRATRTQSAPAVEVESDDDGGDEEDRTGRRRRGRDRYRDRKRRQPTREGAAEDDVELLEDDVLIPVAGILDVLENYAFVRTSGYLAGPSDVYVSLGQVKKAGLRRGDAITGAVRQPREGENQRQKFNALVRLDSVNGGPVEDAMSRADFTALTPVHPDQRLRVETNARAVGGRVIDLLTPIGKGQRVVIRAPRGTGATSTLQHLSSALTANHEDIHLMVVLVDARPEEVTDWQRSAAGEVVASTFDRPATDHTTIAELAIERAKRLVELGQDVVVLLDSLTALGRAYNVAAPPSGRMVAGGVDAAALFPPKKFVGAARNIENGGSLTIVAVELVETGSITDEVIGEELAGTSNCQIRLLRELASAGVFPAIDVNASSTQYLDRLLTADELAVLAKIRRPLAGLEPRQALESLVGKLRTTGSNAEFLLATARTGN